MKKEMKSTKADASQEAALFREIRELIFSARKAVVRNVDAIQVITNFEVGRRIVERQQQGEDRAEYGAALLKELSSRLTKEFGRGFSQSNLEYMRKFYLLYKNRFVKISQMSPEEFPGVYTSEISQMPSGKSELLPKSQMPSGKLAFSLNWSQYVFLVGIKDDDARQKRFTFKEDRFFVDLVF